MIAAPQIGGTPQILNAPQPGDTPQNGGTPQNGSAPQPGGPPQIQGTPQTSGTPVTRSVARTQTPQVQQPQNNTYVPVLYTTQTPPAPVGHIATELHKINTIDQQKGADDLFALLTSQTPDFTTINTLTTPTAALVAIPESSQVTLLYGFGFGTAPIGGTSPLQNKFMMLAGEGGPTIGLPEVRVLPSADMTSMVECIVPTEEVVQRELTTNANFGNFLLNPLAVNTKKKILRWAPIPAFYGYDLLHNNISAAIMYERLLLCTTPTPMIEHAKDFLRALLVGKLRNSDEKPWVAPAEWQKVPHIDAKMWRKTRCDTLFPTLFAPAPQQPQVQAQTMQQTQAQAQTIPQVQSGIPPNLTQVQCTPQFLFQMMQMMQQHSGTQTTIGQPASFQEEKKDDPGSGLKISEHEAAQMKIMCGYSAQSDDSVYPSWFQQILAKNLDEKDKDLIAAQAISVKSRFDEEKITVYPEQRNMVRKRTWCGNEAGAKPMYAYACYGISPFAMLDLTQDEVASMEFQHAVHTEATSVTVADLKASKKKLLATVPDDGHKWKSIIFQLTNFLRNIFATQCPMYIRMLDISKVLRDYDINIILALPLTAKAAILWIIHLQCRHFAHGKMLATGPRGGLLPEFEYLYNMLLSGQIHNISHAALPIQLLQRKETKSPLLPTPSLSKKRAAESFDLTEERLAKLLKLEQQEKDRKSSSSVREPWNETLKEKLSEPLKTAKYPSLHRITQFCKLTGQDTLVPNCPRGVCRNFLVLGRCRWGPKCTLQHKTATDEQVKSILDKLEHFIEKPDELPPGKHS